MTAPASDHKVLLSPSMPKKAPESKRSPDVKPFDSAQVLGSRERLLDPTRFAVGGSLTVTKTVPAVGAFQIKETSSKSPGYNARVVCFLPIGIPPAAGSPR